MPKKGGILESICVSAHPCFSPEYCNFVTNAGIEQTTGRNVFEIEMIYCTHYFIPTSNIRQSHNLRSKAISCPDCTLSQLLELCSKLPDIEM